MIWTYVGGRAGSSQFGEVEIRRLGEVGSASSARRADDGGRCSINRYDVLWEYSDVKWASRWDVYLYATDEQIHWFSIVNSLMIVLFLTGMVAMIMTRTLRRDLNKYNDAESKEEAAEESGWKLVRRDPSPRFVSETHRREPTFLIWQVHGDVFRPPPRAGLLAVYLGTGVQVLGMSVVTMAFAVLGFLSPSNRGGLMTALLLLFVLMGLLAGYVSAVMYKSFGGTEGKLITLKTATMFPGIVALIFFVLNLAIWVRRDRGSRSISARWAHDGGRFF